MCSLCCDSTIFWRTVLTGGSGAAHKQPDHISPTSACHSRDSPVCDGKDARGEKKSHLLLWKRKENKTEARLGRSV